MAAAGVRSWEGIPICDPHFHYWNVHETPNPALGDLGKALPVYLRADFNRDFADLPLVRAGPPAIRLFPRRTGRVKTGMFHCDRRGAPRKSPSSPNALPRG